LNGVILITGGIEGERTQPIHPDLLNWLHQFCGYHAIPLLIEADGSRGKPLKAWADHEPPIPSFVDLVVQVVGLSGVGKPLIEEYVHRVDIFSGLSGLDLEQMITPEALVQVLVHREGAARKFPPQVKKIALLNQADTPGLQSLAQGLSQTLMAFYDSVIISSLKEKRIFAVHESVAGILLAAGESTRYGQPKQLLDWKGQPFVHAVAKMALQGGLAPVLVVTGANAQQVESAVNGLDVTVIRNENWKTGQASSIRAGIESLVKPSSPKTGGAIFLLADQPQITTSVLRALLEKHAEELFPIVAPMVMDRRANPVLFDRATFPDLLTLEGDVGGRAVFHKHPVEYLPWHDDRLLLDVDTPEMYQRLITDDTL
jgi:molybdenum cofactor cytidylyltransferase